MTTLLTMLSLVAIFYVFGINATPTALRERGERRIKKRQVGDTPPLANDVTSSEASWPFADDAFGVSQAPSHNEVMPDASIDDDDAVSASPYVEAAATASPYVEAASASPDQVELIDATAASSYYETEYTGQVEDTNDTEYGDDVVPTEVVGTNLPPQNEVELTPPTTTLMVRWGQDPTTRGVKSFVEMPLSVSDAVAHGWALDTSQNGCNPPGQTYWRGWRYRLNGDPALSLIYNYEGELVGVQTAIAPNDPVYYPDNLLYRNVFNSENNLRVVTIYFNSPGSICSLTTPPLTAAQEPGVDNKDELGSQLYIQTGTDPSTQYAHIHKMEEELVTKSMWKAGSCLPTLGRHYWFNITKDTPCENFVPIALVYNAGKLSGFSWAFLSEYALYTSERFERLQPEATATFFQDNLPTCLGGRPLATMHFFFDLEPWTHLCT